MQSQSPERMRPDKTGAHNPTDGSHCEPRHDLELQVGGKLQCTHQG